MSERHDAGHPAEPVDEQGLPLFELHEAWGHLIRRAQQLHAALWHEMVSGGLTSPQYAVLHVLLRSSAIDQRTLCERASLDRSTTGELVGRLVERGLVQRSRRDDDARRYVLSLTEAGRQALAAAAGPAWSVNRRLVAGLSEDEQEFLRSLLQKLLIVAPSLLGENQVAR